jgi:hypothetical protein
VATAAARAARAAEPQASAGTEAGEAHRLDDATFDTDRGADPDDDDEDRPLLDPERGPRRRARDDRTSPAARRAAPRATPLDPEARPVVRVTIGRIDVRSAPTPASPPAPRPARHQAMGLDEYLRRRDGRDGGAR